MSLTAQELSLRGVCRPTAGANLTAPPCGKNRLWSPAELAPPAVFEEGSFHTCGAVFTCFLVIDSMDLFLAPRKEKKKIKKEEETFLPVPTEISVALRKTSLQFLTH